MRRSKEVYRLDSKPIPRRDFLRQTGMAGLAFGATGALGSIATACGDSQGNQGPAPSGSEVSGEITMVYANIVGLRIEDAWADLFESFQEEYPNVKVNINGIPADDWSTFFDTMSTRIAGGQSPDVIQVATEGQRLFADQGLAMPIDEYLERDRDELEGYFNDVHPNLLEWNRQYSSPDDSIYYLPGEFNTMCMWCNMQMFEEAGVSEPTDNWTWDDYRTAAETIASSGNKFGGYVFPAYFASVAPWFLTNGTNTLNEQWTEATVDNPAAIEAANFMRSMIEEGISPSPGGTFDEFATMADGELAMFGAGRWALTPIRQQDMVDQVKIVDWPQREEKGTPVGWNSYALMRDSQNKEAAWALIKFMTSETASEFFATDLAIVPPRRSVATSDAFVSNSPEGIEKLYDALEYAAPLPAPAEGSLIESEIVDTFTQILAGNANAEEALEQLDESIQSEL